MGGPPLEFINIQPQKGGPPLEFINLQPQNGGPPLEFINHQPKYGGPPLGTISMDLAVCFKKSKVLQEIGSFFSESPSMDNSANLWRHLAQAMALPYNKFCSGYTKVDCFDFLTMVYVC